VNTERTKKILGVVGTALLLVVAILMPRFLPIYGSAMGEIALRDVVRLMPLLFVPLLTSKLSTFSGFKPLSMKRWLLILGLILLVEFAVDLSGALRPPNGLAENSAFAIQVVAVLIGTFLILSWGRRVK
jgi:hypothetical protein